MNNPALNTTFQRRLVRAQDGRRVTLRNVAHPESRIPVDVAGAIPPIRTMHAGAYPHMGYYEDDDGREVSFRMGAMMYEANIAAAFDYYQEGYKFALPLCTMHPFCNVSTLGLEKVWACAYIASLTQIDDGGADSTPAMIQYIGNGFAINLPDAFLMRQQQANQAVRQGMVILLSKITEEQRAAIAACYAQPPVWLQADHHGEITEADYDTVVDQIAVHISPPSRTRMMNTYVSIFLAYTRQGNITQAKLTKITMELNGIGMQITLTPDLVRMVWTVFGQYFNDDAASIFFPKWGNLFANRCLRLQLCMTQAVNVGLTGLVLIRQMIREYPDFCWDQLAALCPAEWANFMDTNETVGDNIYFGFSRRMAEHGVKRYAPVAYCAKQLQLRVSGDQNMNALNTLGGEAVRNAMAIDRMVEDFGHWKQRQRREGGEAIVANFYGDDEPPANFLAFSRRGQEAPANIEGNAQLLEMLRGIMRNPAGNVQPDE